MKKRKTDLFRFVTLRAPELISSDRKALGFVFHPEAEESQFLAEVNDNDLIDSRIAVQDVAETFNAFQNVQEIKDLVGDSWDFSMWLSKNKKQLGTV